MLLECLFLSNHSRHLNMSYSEHISSLKGPQMWLWWSMKANRVPSNVECFVLLVYSSVVDDLYKHTTYVQMTKANKTQEKRKESRRSKPSTFLTGWSWLWSFYYKKEGMGLGKQERERWADWQQVDCFIFFF